MKPGSIGVKNVDCHSAVVELAPSALPGGKNNTVQWLELGVKSIGSQPTDQQSTIDNSQKHQAENGDLHDKINWRRYDTFQPPTKKKVLLKNLQPNFEYFVRLGDHVESFWTSDWPESEKEQATVLNDKEFTGFYALGRRLGRGHFGDVNLCVDRSTMEQQQEHAAPGSDYAPSSSSPMPRIYAVKSMKVVRRAQIEAAQNEVALLRELCHENIVWLKQAFWSKSVLYLVMEYVAGGELFEKISGDDYLLTELDCACYLRQICIALAYIHAKNIVHLDLKVENIMLACPVRRQIKIVDFGIARQLDPKEKTKVMCGTAEFCAPEVLLYDPISTLTDMWSVGVIAYIMVSGLSPFLGDNDAETHANVVAGEFSFDDPAFDQISEAAKDFISQLIIKQKEQRLSADKCLAHDWLVAASSADISCILSAQPSSTVASESQAEGLKTSASSGSLDANGRRLSATMIDTTKLKKYWARRKWKKACGVLRAVQRISLGFTNQRSSTSAFDRVTLAALKGDKSGNNSSISEQESNEGDASSTKETSPAEKPTSKKAIPADA